VQRRENASLSPSVKGFPRVEHLVKLNEHFVGWKSQPGFEYGNLCL
jgi:hypothetical protein